MNKYLEEQMQKEYPGKVWSSVLDERYYVMVGRKMLPGPDGKYEPENGFEPYAGFLSIIDYGVPPRSFMGCMVHPVMFSQDVMLAYAAQFGPDAADVAEWCEIAQKVIDERARKEIPAAGR